MSSRRTMLDKISRINAMKFCIALLLSKCLKRSDITVKAFSSQYPLIHDKHVHQCSSLFSEKQVPWYEQEKTIGTKGRRKNKYNRKKKKMLTLKTRSSSSKTTKPRSGSISEDELIEHVSDLHMSGSGSVLRYIARKRERQESGFECIRDDHQVAYLKNLDRHPTLVLNADFQPLSVLPLSIWSWQETVKSLFSGKITVVEIYPDVNVRAVNMDVPLPSVVALTEYVPQPHQRPAFTRRNVYLRDGYTCQYCGKKFRFYDLTLDHVIPRCKGGKLNWENAVTSCTSCNGKKGCTSPSDLKNIGMRLLKKPWTPTKYELAATAENMMPRRVHPTWRPFLGMAHEPEGSDEEYDAGNIAESAPH